jgi:hypothetical protein
MRKPCSIMTRRVAKKRQGIITRGPKRSACRYASIWFCQGAGDRVRRTYSLR